MRKFVICKVVSTGQPWWFDINSRFRAGMVVTFALNRLLVPNHPVRHYALSNATNYTWMSTSANVLKSCSNAAFLSLPCFSCDTIYIIPLIWSLIALQSLISQIMYLTWMSIWKRSSSCLQARAMSAAFSDAEITADTNDRIVKCWKFCNSCKYVFGRNSMYSKLSRFSKRTLTVKLTSLSSLTFDIAAMKYARCAVEAEVRSRIPDPAMSSLCVQFQTIKNRFVLPQGVAIHLSWVTYAAI